MHFIKMTVQANLAHAIKKRRRSLKITQHDLAQIAGISLRSLKGIETDQANPTWNQVAKLLDALGWEIELREKKS